MIASDASALVFALNKEMTTEDIFKEFNQKVRTCTLPNKLITQAMISIAMTYEALCATARATAAVANNKKEKWISFLSFLFSKKEFFFFPQISVLIKLNPFFG
jgi:hypothetical protein